MRQFLTNRLVGLHFFVESDFLYHNMQNNFWKCWVIPEIRNIFSFQLYLEKVENGAKCVETKMFIGRHDAEVGSLFKCLIIYYRQRDLTLEASLEIFVWQKMIQVR